MIRYLLFLTLAIFTFSVQAQVPGYKGKKWVISYNPHIFSRVLYSSTEDFLDYITPHFRHSLEIGKVHSRHLLIAGFADYVNLSNTYFEEPFPIRGFSSGASIYFFNYKGKGAIAPLGNYGKLSVGLTCYTIIDRNNIFTSDPKVLEKKMAPLLMYSIGKKNLLFEALLTDFGVQFGLLMPTFGKASHEELHDSSRKSLWNYYLFNFYLGIGFIPL